LVTLLPGALDARDADAAGQQQWRRALLLGLDMRHRLG
jgi:hypothetical protein